jgi:exonuclease SbcC
MLLTTLRLRHYKQYGSLDLEFREGLVGIIGRNGAGKSTIFEAILYCLYGKDEINNKELIRSAFSDPKAPVLLELDFSIGETGYRVRRELRGRKLETVTAELYKNDQQIAKGAGAVNDEIARLLKLDRDAFKRSVFSGQRELTELSDTKGEKRTKMVRKMLGLEHLDDIQTEVNKDKNNLRNQIAGQEQLLLSPEEYSRLQAQILELEQTLQTEQARLQEEQSKQTAIETQYKEQKARFEAETQKLNRFNDIRRRQTQLGERQEGLAAQHKNLQDKIASLQAKQTELDREGQGFKQLEADQKALQLLEADRQKHTNHEAVSGKIKALQEPLQQSRRRIAELETQLVQLPELEKELGAQQQASAGLQQEREAKLAEYQELQKALAGLEERIRERKAKIESLQAIGQDGTCPTCFQPVRNAYEDVLHQLAAEINAIQQEEKQKLLGAQEKVRQEGTDIKTRLDALQSRIEQLQADRARLQELQRQHKSETANFRHIESQINTQEVVLRGIGPFRFDQQEYDRLRAAIAEQEPRYRQYLQDKNYIARELPQAKTDFQKIEQSIQDTKAQIAVAATELQQLQYDEAVYQEVKDTFGSFDERLKAQSAIVQQLLTVTFQQQNTLNTLRDKIAQHERVRQQIAARQTDIELLEKLSELLKQFKTEILERVSPGISREAGALFSRITLGKYESIRVDDIFEFYIADGGVFYPLERFSGGEIDLANFCLRIAITKAIMDLSGSGQAVEFLAFDEIFGSQDEERRHEMMLALNLLQEQFRQIYIVSHIESQKDYFPNILEVKFEAGGSVTRWVG